MELSQLPYCYFIVYTFKGLPIVKTDFDQQYFIDLVYKVNSFYKNYLLKVLCHEILDLRLLNFIC